MSSNHKYLIVNFIEYHSNNFHQFLHNLRMYYNNYHLQLFKKYDNYLLYFTIIISIITLIIILLILIESNILSKYFLFIHSFYKKLILKIKKKFFRTKPLPLFFIWSLNPSNHIQKCLINQFIHSLNQKFFYKTEQLNVETLQFDNAKLHHISQTSLETIIINAILDIDHLIFHIKDRNYTIKIPKLTGELEIFLTNNTNQYTIEIKFKTIQIDNTEIIDLNNTLSPDDRQSIIKLLKEIISKTIIQYCFRISDNQENTVNGLKTPSSIPPITLQHSDISSQEKTVAIPSIIDSNQQISPKIDTKKLLVRVVKAVKLHDVEQPYCTLELNQPKQIQQTSIAKNGLNPFWDEKFLFQCNDKSNHIRLQIINRKKPNRKLNLNNLDTVYADVLIPFSYITSTIYKQDIQITPQYPDSIIRIEFSTLSEEDALIANNKYDVESISDSENWSIIYRESNKLQHNYQQLPSEELSHTTDTLSKDYRHENNIHNNSSIHSRPTILNSTTDTLSTITPITSNDDNIPVNKIKKSRSFLSSIRHFSFSRRKKHKKDKQIENNTIQPVNTTTEPNIITHSLSAEPFVSTNPTSLRRNHTISQSFRNFFRSNSKKKSLTTNNFIIDHPDLISTSTPTPKKHSFLRRFKSKQRQQASLSINSLTSDDCTRSESVRNTPVRANVGRPVTMTNLSVQ